MGSYTDSRITAHTKSHAHVSRPLVPSMRLTSHVRKPAVAPPRVERMNKRPKRY